MAKSIVRFSFPGNIVWYPESKDRWAKILTGYVASELAIGNGQYLNTEPCTASIHESGCAASLPEYKNHIIAEIICDIPQEITHDEFAVRARLITLLENGEFDFVKFHNCGPGSDTRILAQKPDC